MASSALLVAPEGDRSIHGKPFDRAVQHLTGYRSAYRKLEGTPKRGGEQAWLAHAGRADEFNIGEFTEDEAEMLLELCKAHGGDYLLIWTCGSTVQTLLVRGSRGEDPSIRELSLRLDAPTGGRRAGLAEDFLSWFEGTAFSPDAKRLRSELAAPRISVKEVDNAETLGLWDDLEQVAHSLLRGQRAEQAAVRRINKETGESAEENGLTSKPFKQPGRTARLLADAVSDLAAMIGEAASEEWKRRRRAAGFYWDITDCEGACSRLTTGTDKKGLGRSASMGRLLAHYPADLMRDGLFHALAGLEAEGANGHAYVESFLCLAECAHESGFTLAVFPAELQTKFRERFGIVAFEDDGGASTRDGLAAEAFVDLRGSTKGDSLPAIEKWFQKTKAGGWCLRAEHDGTWKLLRYEAGASSEHDRRTDDAPLDADALAAAARSLDPRAAMSALGLPDVLEPGEWREGAYAGEKGGVDTEEREQALESLDSPPNPRKVHNAQAILADFERVIGGDGMSSFKVVLPGESEAWRRDLMRDLLGRHCIDTYGSAWLTDTEVIGYTWTHLAKACFVRTLGDLPDGTRIVLKGAERPTLHYEIDGSIEPQHPTCGDLCYGWTYDESMAQELTEADDQDWAEEMLRLNSTMAFDHFLGQGLKDWSIIKNVLLEEGDREYYEVDISGFEHEHAVRHAEIAAGMESHGLRPLGDLICSQLANVVARGFASADLPVYGTMMIPTYGEPVVEFYTRFADGSSLTTTPQSNLGQGRSIRFQCCPDVFSVEELWNRHMAEVTKTAKQGIEPQAGTESLAGLAEAIEEFLQRQLGGLFRAS
jgi:hypothetical protein